MLKSIISASRRTDIPAFYSEWFLQRLKEEHVYVKNPYGGQVHRVSLKPGDIHALVLWSKNFSPLISRIEAMERVSKNLFFHFTITGMPDEIERHTPPFEEALDDFICLSKRYSPYHLVWRFDPICITDRLPFEYFEEVFSRCAERLKGHCARCHISFVQKYKKALANVEKYSDHKLADVARETQREYAGRLSTIGEQYGIKLFACCNDYLLSDSVQKAGCISSSEYADLFNDGSISSPRAPTRKECACTKSLDIGSYGTCPHGCLYCYANADKEKARAAYKKVDMRCNGLGFHVEEESMITCDYPQES